MSSPLPSLPSVNYTEYAPPTTKDTSPKSCCNWAKVGRVALAILATVLLIGAATCAFGAFSSVSLFTGALAAGAFSAAAAWVALPVTASAFLALGITSIVAAAKIKDYTNPKELQAYRDKAQNQPFDKLYSYHGPKNLVNYVFNRDYMSDITAKTSTAIANNEELSTETTLSLPELEDKLSHFVHDHKDTYCVSGGRELFTKQFNLKYFVDEEVMTNDQSLDLFKTRAESGVPHSAL